MTYDLIIVAKSSTPELIKMTQRAIDSAGVNTILVETGEITHYDGVSKIVKYEGEFNYNRALNMGLHEAYGDIYILANNDVYFHKGWDVIGELMRFNGFESASALSNDKRQKGFIRGDFIYPGYTIGRELTGWCLFLTRQAYERIGRIDESVEFWYSDNVYADQLREHGLRHGLFCNIQVDHLESRTLKTIPRKLQRKYSVISGINYAQRKRVNEVNT